VPEVADRHAAFEESVDESAKLRQVAPAITAPCGGGVLPRTAACPPVE
jgi:hypothetical protein